MHIRHDVYPDLAGETGVEILETLLSDIEKAKAVLAAGQESE